jgi:hypothetical protein
MNLQEYEPRKKCVLCDNSNFIDVFSYPNAIHYVEDINIRCDLDIEVKLLNFIGCLNCGCVQLQNLFDPIEIYKNNSHYTLSDTFHNHDELFTNFILKNILNFKNILEIGGGSGKLAKQIINNFNQQNIEINYKIFDISTQYFTNDIEYINGNCETYDFNSLDSTTIILSHTFEHLYQPKKFIKNISSSLINEIFISNPDMENLIKMNDINSLNIQHTFYIDTNFIKGLLNEYFFELKNIYYFNNNSIFYHFIKRPSTVQINYKNENLIPYLQQFYYNITLKINNIRIDYPFFICPSGFYGQIIFYYLNQTTKNNIIGFLDSDINKIGKRLCGTSIVIFEKEHIKNYQNPIVLLISNKYENEIKTELLYINNNTSFLNF